VIANSSRSLAWNLTHEEQPCSSVRRRALSRAVTSRSTEDVAAGAYDVGGQKCHVSHAGAYLQHSHSGGESGGAEEFFGVRAQDSSLQLQALILMIGLSENVVGGGWAAHCCAPSRGKADATTTRRPKPRSMAASSADEGDVGF